MLDFKIHNTVCCVLYLNNEDKKTWLYEERIGKIFIEHSNFRIKEGYDNETLMWNYGIELDENLSNNMDLCRTCVEEFIKQGKIVSEKFINDTYNDQCRSIEKVSKENKERFKKLEKDKILFQIIRKEITEKDAELLLQSIHKNIKLGFKKKKEEHLELVTKYGDIFVHESDPEELNDEL